MEMRRLGRTKMIVSAIGMGGIPIQRVSESQASAVIETAVSYGINFIDTARAYSDSEAKIGRVLVRHREKLIIATKSMARNREDMKKEIERSLQDLKTDYIDLYQVHNVKDESSLEQVLAPDGALVALKEARELGKVRHIGITGHIPAVLVKAVRTGEFETVQFPFNPIETAGIEELLPLASQMDAGTIAMKPFAGGALKNKVLTLKFILEKGFATVIPGMDTPQQVEENILATEGRLLTEEDNEVLREEVSALEGNLCRRCEYCLPCSQGIDIPLVFLLDGYWTRYGLQEWAVEGYQPLRVKASECADCGECETRCPYGLPIREMLREAAGHLEKR
ncbi:MAG: aldo/keto reductase [Firmicutes bacterium HGW-Firmicutes-14]|nr:MAG: aldo/keto reductase [Firmicutes bacterium HGW-Firmicutes-14]